MIMTKNKKLFALLMLPAVIAMMVLPLCSFTTVYNSNDNYIYSSLSNICLPYCYDYGTSGTYYGMLNNCSRVLIPESASTFSQVKSSIKFTASDYYITGNSRISISNTNNYFGSDWLNQNEDFDNETYIYPYRMSLLYKSNNSNTYFTNRFYIENYNFGDNIGFYFVNGDDLISLSGREVYVSGKFSFRYWYYNDEIDSYGTGVYGERVIPFEFHNDYYYPSFYVSSLILEAIEHTFNRELEDFIYYEIGYVDFEVIPYLPQIDGETGETLIMPVNKFDGIIVISNILDIENSEYAGFVDALINYFDDDSIYWKGFDNGYVRGKNAGLSSASSVWGSLGTFLTETVGSFLNTPLFPGFNVSIIVTVFVGAMLLIAFLKLFAGG